MTVLSILCAAILFGILALYQQVNEIKKQNALTNKYLDLVCQGIIQIDEKATDTQITTKWCLACLRAYMIKEMKIAAEEERYDDANDYKMIIDGLEKMFDNPKEENKETEE